MNMNNEIWKDIPGYEGSYQVSNLGRVKSLDRKTPHWLGGYRIIKGKIMKPQKNKFGYLNVMLNIPKVYPQKRTRKSIHQLVAISFLNHKPDGHNSVIDHKDGNKENNCVDNLELVSMRENNIRRCLIHHNHREINLTGYTKTRDGKYQSQIAINGVKVYLGRFDTQEEASNAYQKKLKEIYE